MPKLDRIFLTILIVAVWVALLLMAMPASGQELTRQQFHKTYMLGGKPE